MQTCQNCYRDYVDGWNRTKCDECGGPMLPRRMRVELDHNGRRLDRLFDGDNEYSAARQCARALHGAYWADEDSRREGSDLYGSYVAYTIRDGRRPVATARIRR